MYGEDMKIEMEIHSEKDQAINIEFLLNTSENYPIGVLNNVFANESIEVTKGLNKYSLCVDLPMVPR